MKKDGFVSTTLIYSFFVLFLLLMMFLLTTYSRSRLLLEQYKDQIKEEMMELADINLRIHVQNNNGSYDLVDEIPRFRYFLDNDKSSCNIPNYELVYEDNVVKVGTSGKITCDVYLNIDEADVILTLYKKEYANSTPVEITNIPNSYDSVESTCGDNVVFDGSKFTIKSTSKISCSYTFIINNGGE